MRFGIMAVACGMLIAGCSSAPRTDDELAARAQNAVDHKLGAQATFSMMESAVVLHISCGHAHATVPSVGIVDKDFVYRDDTLLMEDDAGFDAAAAQCDAAIGGGNDSEGQ